MNQQPVREQQGSTRCLEAEQHEITTSSPYKKRLVVGHRARVLLHYGGELERDVVYEVQEKYRVIRFRIDGPLGVTKRQAVVRSVPNLFSGGSFTQYATYDVPCYPIRILALEDRG